MLPPKAQIVSSILELTILIGSQNTVWAIQSSNPGKYPRLAVRCTRPPIQPGSFPGVKWPERGCWPLIPMWRRSAGRIELQLHTPIDLPSWREYRRLHLSLCWLRDKLLIARELFTVWQFVFWESYKNCHRVWPGCSMWDDEEFWHPDILLRNG